MTRQLFALTVALTFGITGASAMNFTSGMFNFKTGSSPQRCIVTGVAGYLEGEIEIPATVSFCDEDGNSAECTVTGIDKEALQGQSEVTSFILPPTLETIGEKAFSGCSMLEAIGFPDAVTAIGDMAIDGCAGIKTIVLGSKLETIGYMAFESASRLEKVTITATNPPVLDDEDTFNWQVLSTMVLEVPAGSVEAYKNAGYWSDITNIVAAQTATPDRIVADGVVYAEFSEEVPFTCIATGLDESFSGSDLVIHGEIEAAGKTYVVTTIGEDAFKGATFSSVSIEKGIERIDTQAFRECAEIKTITLPSSLNSIGEYAFWGCKGIEKIAIPDGITEIPDWAFAYCGGMKEIAFPAGLKSIGFKAFFQDKNLEGLSFPDGLEKIGNEAFEECKGIQSIAIPTSVTSIGELAFYQCQSLAEITIDAAITELSASVFAYSGVKHISFPPSLISIGKNAFEQCNNLEEIDIPASVTRIGGEAFTNSIALAKVTGMENVTEVGGYAFYECEALSEIAFSDKLENMGNGVFMRCTSLEELTIPSGEIGQYTFLGCSGIKTLSLGKDVTAIGSEAFRECSGITEVITDAIVPPALSADSFETEVYSSASLKVPSESITSYSTAPGWQKFQKITAGTETVTYIDSAFTTSGNEVLILSDENISIFSIDGKTVVSGTGMSGRRIVLDKGAYTICAAGRSVKMML